MSSRWDAVDDSSPRSTLIITGKKTRTRDHADGPERVEQAEPGVGHRGQDDDRHRVERDRQRQAPRAGPPAQRAEANAASTASVEPSSSPATAPAEGGQARPRPASATPRPWRSTTRDGAGSTNDGTPPRRRTHLEQHERPDEQHDRRGDGAQPGRRPAARRTGRSAVAAAGAVTRAGRCTASTFRRASRTRVVSSKKRCSSRVSSSRSRGRSTSTTSAIRPGPRRHDDHAGRQEHRLGDGVGDEDDRRAALAPDLEQLGLHPLAGHLVQRAERLVHEQDRRAGRPAPGRWRPAAACRPTAATGRRRRTRPGRPGGASPAPGPAARPWPRP